APVPWWRQASFALSLVLLAGAAVMPLEDELFWVHMTQHVIIGDLAALAFVIGLTGPLLRPLLTIDLFSRLRVLAHPLVALPLALASALRGGATPRCRARARAHLLLHRRRVDVGRCRRGPAGPRVVRNRREVRLRRRRAARRDGARKRLHLVRHRRLPHLRRRRHAPRR